VLASHCTVKSSREYVKDKVRTCKGSEGFGMTKERVLKWVNGMTEAQENMRFLAIMVPRIDKGREVTMMVEIMSFSVTPREVKGIKQKCRHICPP
jgi:hypothetical protein